MAVKFSNNASATLSSGITNTATSIVVSSGQGALFPSLSGSDFFFATLVDSSNNLEIVRVTARSSDTLTVVRGQDGTTARAYLAGDRIELRPVAAALDNKMDKDGSTMTGGLTFSGTGLRMIGDFTNATITNRFSFVTSTANSATGIYALPSGTGNAASWQATNNSDPTNASKVLIATNGSTDVQLVSGINGSGTYLPLSFYTGGSERARFDTSGNWIANSSVTGYWQLPNGTTAQRPGSPASGMIRFNSSLTQFEGHNGAAWGSIGGGATGGAASASTTASGTNGTNTVTVASATGIAVGYTATGTGFNTGTTVTAIAGTTITLSANLTQTISASAVTFSANDKVFWENDQTITTNYTLTTGKNAGTFGPVTINSGVTVTVPSGSTWTLA